MVHSVYSHSTSNYCMFLHGKHFLHAHIPEMGNDKWISSEVGWVLSLRLELAIWGFRTEHYHCTSLTVEIKWYFILLYHLPGSAHNKTTTQKARCFLNVAHLPCSPSSFFRWFCPKMPLHDGSLSIWNCHECTQGIRHETWVVSVSPGPETSHLVYRYVQSMCCEIARNWLGFFPQMRVWREDPVNYDMMD
jgi:hypothetical protein